VTFTLAYDGRGEKEPFTEQIQGPNDGPIEHDQQRLRVYAWLRAADAEPLVDLPLDRVIPTDDALNDQDAWQEALSHEEDEMALTMPVNMAVWDTPSLLLTLEMDSDDERLRGRWRKEP